MSSFLAQIVNESRCLATLLREELRALRHFYEMAVQRLFPQLRVEACTIALRGGDGGAVPGGLREHPLCIKADFFHLTYGTYPAGSFHLRQQRLRDPEIF